MAARKTSRLAIVGQAPRVVERADAARNRKLILAAARKLLERRATGEICPVAPETTASFILAMLDPDLIGWHLQRGRSRDALRKDFRRFWRSGVLDRNTVRARRRDP